MRKPDQSLDEFVVKAAPEITTEPPRPVTLRFTGEVEVLKPLVRMERPAKPEPASVDTLVRPAPHRLSWFHRSLVLAGGLVIIAFILVSAIFIGIYDPPAEPAVSQIDTGDPSDLAIDGQPYGRRLPAEEPLTSDVFTTASSQPASDKLHAVRSSARPRPAGPRVQLASYRPRRHPRRSQLVRSKFVPTTLVIYLENGEIKTRIEPQLTAGYKKPLTLPN